MRARPAPVMPACAPALHISTQPAPRSPPSPPLPALPALPQSPRPLPSLSPIFHHVPSYRALPSHLYGRAWQKAQVLTVLVDGWFQARITTRSDSWDDWFNWSEEGSDWRRKAKHAPLAVRGPHKRERSEPRRPAERREGWLEGGVSTAGGEVRVDPSKLRLRLDRAKREAMLLPSLSVRRTRWSRARYLMSSHRQHRHKSGLLTQRMWCQSMVKSHR